MSAKKLSLSQHDIHSMEACPVCREKDLVLRKSKFPEQLSYIVVCSYCEKANNAVAISGQAFPDEPTLTNHRRAKQSAINAWNHRPFQETDLPTRNELLLNSEGLSNLRLAVLLSYCPGCGREVSSKTDLRPNKTPFQWHPKCAERCFTAGQAVSGDRLVLTLAERLWDELRSNYGLSGNYRRTFAELKTPEQRVWIRLARVAVATCGTPARRPARRAVPR